MLAAVLAGDGLRRVTELAAQATGGVVALIAPQLGGTWAAPARKLGEEDRQALERYVAQALRGEDAAPPACVALEAPIASETLEIGAVLLIEGAQGIGANAAELLRFAAAAALTEHAILAARLEGEQRLRGSLLQELRDQRELDVEDLLERAARAGSSLQRGAVALCAEVRPAEARQVLLGINGECADALAEYLGREHPGESRRLHVLIPARGRNEGADTRALARRLAVRIGRHGVVGISSYCANPRELRSAIQEAELMLDVLLQSGSGTPIAEATPSMGTYRLLFRVLISNPSEIEDFFEETVAPIVAYDEQYRTELLSTLKAYLAHNCSMNATAEALVAHRHTVAYRLDRIEELTGLDPRQAEHREQLGLGLKTYRIIQSRLQD